MKCLQLRPCWNRFCVINITLIFRWWLPLVNKTHTSSEYTSVNRSSKIIKHGSPCAFAKLLFSGTPLWYCTFLFNADNCCLLSVTPDYPSFKFLFRAQRVEVLQESNADCWFTRTTRTCYDTGKMVLEPDPLVHWWCMSPSPPFFIYLRIGQQTDNRTEPNYYRVTVSSWKTKLCKFYPPLPKESALFLPFSYF